MVAHFLSLAEGSIAYQRQVGDKRKPGVIFLSGFASDMTGSKASFLSDFCASRAISFLRFDYRGCGQSPGDFASGTIGCWLEDAKAAFDNLTEGAQIVVGSSMGGWLGLLLARIRSERIKALIGVAAAPDFTEDLVWDKLTQAGREDLLNSGYIREEGDRPPITLKLIEEARSHLILRSPIDVSCPVRLLQGMQDAQVPWQHSVRTAEAITHKDVRITMVKDGDHSLSSPENLALLGSAVTEFITPS